MLGRFVLVALLIVPVGIGLGLTRIPAFEAIGTVFFLGGSAVLGLALLVALVLAVEAVVFRRPDRWTRFN